MRGSGAKHKDRLRTADRNVRPTEMLERRVLMSAVDPVINEFMASNSNGITDEDGLHSDWIEIFNPGSSPVDLAGWHLTDDPALPHEFTFPSTIINPGGYQLVFATGVNQSIAGGELHAGFKLDANGEYLGLSRPDGTVTSEFDPFPQQVTDVAYGFLPGTSSSATVLGSGTSARYLIPSDGSLNTDWTDPDFVDSAWPATTTGIGFSPRGNDPLPRETELNGSIGSANSAFYNFAPSSGNFYQLGISGAAITTSDDWFKIGKLDLGDVITVAAAGSGGARSGGSTNLSVELWRAGSATAVIVDADGGPANDALINRFAIGTNDTYYIRVRATVAGNYQVGAWLENSGVNPLFGATTTSETEANDTLATANDFSSSWRAVPYLSRTSGTITTNDTDIYSYSLTAGSVLSVNIDSTSVLDAKVSLLNSAGTVIASEDGTSTGPGADSWIYAFNIPTTGTYFVQVNAASGTGTYNADVYLSSATPPPVSTTLFTLVSGNIDAPMRNINASAYVRVPFTTADPSTIGSLFLKIKYNDGFVAYLNGTKIAERNAPASLAFDSTATGSRSIASSVIAETIDITAFKDLLVDVGNNILAIQGLNSSAGDGNFLIAPELISGNFVPGAIQYMTTPTPASANVAGALGVVADTTFSVDRGFYDAPFSLGIASDTVGAQIRYTLDGSVPTASSGFVYSGPFTVGPALYGTVGGPAKPGVIVVRAAAFKTGWISTNVDSESYIFLDSVITQDAAGLPDTWGYCGGYGGPGCTIPLQTAGSLRSPPGPDYALDPTVVNSNIAVIKNSFKTLPTVSLSMPINDWFGPSGIYPAGIGTSKPVSMEYMDPSGQDFQVDGGVQITGGGTGGTSAQRWKTYKLSMRLKFKEITGDSSLDFPLYGADAADSFDTLVLDAQINNTWLHTSAAQRADAMLIQDQYIADLQTAMTGEGTGPHGKFVHLYINGLYWGVYDLHERPDEHFATAYYGGDDTDWDVISHLKTNAVNNGVQAVNDFQDLLNRASADMTNPANYAAVQQVLDVDDFIDYILVNFYAGNMDWSQKNWYATFNRNDPAGRWRFHSWDAEHIFESAQNGVLSATADVTGLNQVDSPTAIYQKLLVNPEFKMRFADHVQKHFFNGGVLTPGSTAAMYQARMNEVDSAGGSAMIAESARWGDNRRAGNSYTRANWFAFQQRLLTEYFPVRTNNVVNQLRSRGAFPTLGAPTFSNYGGTFAGAQNLSMANPGAGTIYYTTDGSDPRLAGGAINPGALTYSGTINLSSSSKVQARVFDGTIWSALQAATFIIGPPPAIRVSEMMYHPRGPGVGSPYIPDDFEYIELQNTGASLINLAGIQFTKGITFSFASGSLAAGARTILVGNQAAFESRYGTGLPIGGVYTGTLSDSGEKIRLETGLGQEIEEFTYKDGWYPQTDGEGFSLVTIDPNASDVALSDKDGWRASQPIDGGPGVADPGINPGSIVINEILSRGSAPSSDWIEFANTTNSPIDISGWALSDSAGNLLKYILQPGSIVAAHGFLVLDEQSSFGVLGNPGVNQQFDFSKSGDEAYLSQRVGAPPALAGYRESVDFGAADVDVPFARYIKSSGAKDFVPESSATKNAANSYPKVGPVVINEINYRPPPNGIEFIELKNISGSAVQLYDPANPGQTWRFTNGITYNFADGDTIPANGFALIVGSTPALFRSTYNVPANVAVFGPFSGQLNNGGEQVELSKYGGLDSTTGLPTWIMVDRVSYNNVAPWPTTPSGGGPSLSRYLLNTYSNDSVNWIASSPAPTPGSPNAIILTGQSGGDNYYVRQGPAGVTQVYRNDPTFAGAPDFSFPGNGLDQLVINAGLGNDSVVIDLPGGVGLPASGLNFNGEGGDDAITLLSPPTSTTPLRLDVGSGTNTLNFQSGQVLAGLTVPASAVLNLPVGGKALKVMSLSIAGGATMNINDNDLVVQADAASWQGILNSIGALVASGRNSAASRWLGSGIDSSTAAANSLRNTGLATIANRTTGGAARYTTFNGQSVDENSILVKYTYNGDANADGIINPDDFAAVDGGFINRTTGYANGDFNYSGGPPDADDYFEIDRAFGSQGGALSGDSVPQAAASSGEIQSVTKKKPNKQARRVRHHHRHSHPIFIGKLLAHQG